MKLATLCAGAALLAATGPFVGAAERTGQEVFERHCVHCHDASNEAVGTLQLARTRGQDKALLTERRDLPPEYIRIVVRHGLRAMPAFVPSDLTDTELQALTDYLTKQRM